MVGCRTDVDCRGRCGEHPVHGKHYVCSHDVDFYTLCGRPRARLERHVRGALRGGASGSKSEGKPHARIWLPDPANPDTVLCGHARRRRVRSQRRLARRLHRRALQLRQLGMRRRLGNTARDDGHRDAVTSRGAGIGLSHLFCGASSRRATTTLSPTSGIAEADEEYPRTLVPAAKVNGKLTPRIVCFNSFDCKAKCDFFERTAREGGLPAPHACAMCVPPCPSNFGTWLLDTREAAMVHDILQAVRLAAICVNPVACACQVFMMMKPSWLDQLPNEMAKCRGGDVFTLIMDRMIAMIIELIEGYVNDVIRDHQAAASTRRRGWAWTSTTSAFRTSSTSCAPATRPSWRRSSGARPTRRRSTSAASTSARRPSA